MSNDSNDGHTQVESRLIPHAYFLLVLVVLTAGLRDWQVSHTEVAARDSIGFIRYAWNLDQSSDWKKVFREGHQHPGFPVAIHLFSLPARFFWPEDLPRAYQLSAQFTASFFSVLLVFPLYFLGKEFFNRWQAFWIVALFQILPATSKVLGDGLSESMFLSFATAGLLFAVQGYGRPGIRCWFLSGLFSGAAYLVRPEGLVVAAASSLLLLGRGVWWRDKEVRQHSFRALAATLAGTVILAAPFMLVIGKITSKPTGNIILNQATVGVMESEIPNYAANPNGQGETVALASWWSGGDGTQVQRILWASFALADAYVKGLNYFGLLLALAGLALSGPLFRRDPRLIILVLVFFLLNIALFRVAKVMGYLSERHALFGILIAMLWIPPGAANLGRGIRILLRKNGHDISGLERIIPAVALLALALPSLAKSMETLHYNREGFKQAGQWLSEHIQPGDPVEDPFCWSHFYAGKVFLEGKQNLPHSKPRLKYVVVERSKNPHVRLQTQKEEDLLKMAGQVVFSWDAKKTKSQLSVVVYSVPVPGG
ncbi:MAG: hypothetical protein EXR99_14735 [Gemmataceae bacterium]|nr:hypothetical protein [Gemmataceae bacterium]